LEGKTWLMTTPRGIASLGINWLPVVTMHLK
jgi:hypothetical protein